MLILMAITQSSCLKEKTIATYNFNDGNIITKLQKGKEIRYVCKKGHLDNAIGDILVVQDYNLSNNFGDYRDRANYFSAIYNINTTDPIMRFDEYFVVVHLYPNSELIIATKGTHNISRTMYTLRTFDGNTFQFPITGMFNKISGYSTEYPARIQVDDETGLIKIYPKTFRVTDITPEEIKGNKIYLDWSKHQ